MTRPSPTGKKSVNLASPGVRVSRIRRDPPPVVKEKFVDLKEREQWDVTIGVLAFALAIFVIILAFGGYSGRSPVQYTVELNYAE
jgi:hypothetical protein